MTRLLWWRQLRADAAAVATLLLLLALTTFLAVAGTRGLTAVDDDAVQYALVTSPERDDVLAAYQTTLTAADGTAADLLGIRDDVLASMADPLSAVLDPAVVAVSTPELALLGADDALRSVELPPIGVTLTAIASASPEVRYLEGRAPRQGTDATGPFPLLADARAPTSSRVVEVAIAELPATAASISVGQVLALGGPSPVIVEVTGIFEPLDPTAYFWARQDPLLTDEPVYGPDGVVSDSVTVLVPPAGFESFVTATSAGIGAPLELQVALQYPLALDRIHAESVPALLAAADRAESKPVAVGDTDVRVTTSMQTPLHRYLSQHGTAYAVLAIGIAGQAVTALTVLVLAGRLLTERRRGALALAARGGRRCASSSAPACSRPWSSRSSASHSGPVLHCSWYRVGTVR